MKFYFDLSLVFILNLVSCQVKEAPKYNVETRNEEVKGEGIEAVLGKEKTGPKKTMHFDEEYDEYDFHDIPRRGKVKLQTSEIPHHHDEHFAKGGVPDELDQLHVPEVGDHDKVVFREKEMTQELDQLHVKGVIDQDREEFGKTEMPKKLEAGELDQNKEEFRKKIMPHVLAPDHLPEVLDESEKPQVLDPNNVLGVVGQDDTEKPQVFAPEHLPEVLDETEKPQVLDPNNISGVVGQDDTEKPQVFAPEHLPEVLDETEKPQVLDPNNIPGVVVQDETEKPPDHLSTIGLSPDQTSTPSDQPQVTKSTSAVNSSYTIREIEEITKTVNPVNVPYIALVMKRNGDTCTATIIRSRWLMTTAKCLSGSQKNDVRVYFGIVNDGSYTYRIKVDELFVHPHYYGDLWYDIGLIQLARPIHAGSFKFLQFNRDLWLTNETYRCIAAGYNDGISNKLHTLATCSHQTCLCLDENQFICTNETSLDQNRGINDIGGPLVCNGKLVAVRIGPYNRSKCNWFVEDKANIKMEKEEEEEEDDDWKDDILKVGDAEDNYEELIEFPDIQKDYASRSYEEPNTSNILDNTVQLQVHSRLQFKSNYHSSKVEKNEDLFIGDEGKSEVEELKSPAIIMVYTPIEGHLNWVDLVLSNDKPPAKLRFPPPPKIRHESDETYDLIKDVLTRSNARNYMSCLELMLAFISVHLYEHFFYYLL